MRERIGRVQAIREVGRGVLAIDIAAHSPKVLSFRPGQFVSVAIDGGERRSYSIASPPTRTDGFELLIKPSGTGGAARFVAGLEEGSEIRFFGPMGYFYYQAGAADVVFAATGVGISAIWSMVLASLADPGPRSLKLFWGNRKQEDVFWSEELARLASQDPRFFYQICISDGEEGRITPHVRATAQADPSAVYYLCGNGQMVHALSRDLRRAGVEPDQIRTEAFYP